MFINWIGSMYWAYGIFAWVIGYIIYRIIKRECSVITQLTIERYKPVYWWSLTIAAVLIYAYAFHAYNPPQTDFDRNPDAFTSEQMETTTPNAEEVKEEKGIREEVKKATELKEKRDELKEIVKDRDDHLKNMLKGIKETN